jgi:hypothetical protein
MLVCASGIYLSILKQAFISLGEYFMRLSENGYFSQSLRQAQIIILEILQCIPVVIIFSFLDLEKTISFSDNLLRALL